MYNVLTLNKISENGLKNFDSAKYACGPEIENPSAVIVRSASMLEMEIPESVMAIARAGAGYNNIPVDKCTKKGICVFNTPGANANAVKELVICALFMSSRRIAPSLEWCKTLKGEEDVSKKIEKGKSQFAGPEILGKTLGVMGLGAIGVKVADAALSLGMNVLGYDPYVSEKTLSSLSDGVTVVKDLNDLISASDYITLHVPLNDSTKGVIGKDAFKIAKDGVRILNFARGALVDEDALLDAVKSGKCASYATDFPTEKMIGTENIIAIPHLGASTPESEENCAVMAVKQISSYIEKGNIVNSVNLPCVEKELSPNKKRITVITDGDKSREVFKVLSDLGVDTSDSVSLLRGDAGYIIVDSENIPENAASVLEGEERVIKARVI